MTEYAERNCAPKTIERYRELAAYAIRQSVEIAGTAQSFGDARMDEFKAMQLQFVVNALRDRGGQETKAFPGGRPLAPKTVRHIMPLVHGVFERAVIWELIERNPCAGVDLPAPPEREPKVVEKDGVTKLLARAQGTRLYPLIVLGLATGARRGELLALQWSDIDFDSGIITVSKSLDQTKAGLRVKSTKSKKPRRFALRPRHWTLFAGSSRSRMRIGGYSGMTTGTVSSSSASRTAATTARIVWAVEFPS
jgi:integrase